MRVLLSAVAVLLLLLTCHAHAEMFVPLFEHAERLDGGEPYDAAAAAEVIRATFTQHLR